MLSAAVKLVFQPGRNGGRLAVIFRFKPFGQGHCPPFKGKFVERRIGPGTVYMKTANWPPTLAGLPGAEFSAADAADELSILEAAAARGGLG